jgi:phosphatidylethanolamine N-methyltransferase
LSGWLYSDFFLVDRIPSKLAYTGIYRFLNNPERSMGGAAFLGLSLISGSKLVALLAVVSHLSHWWFLSFVEKCVRSDICDDWLKHLYRFLLFRPHMQKLYGERLRKDGGLTKTLKTVAGKHARKLESRAGRHAPELKRAISEVKETMVRVEERVSEAMEEFLQSGECSPLVPGQVALKLTTEPHRSSTSTERGGT